MRLDGRQRLRRAACERPQRVLDHPAIFSQLFASDTPSREHSESESKLLIQLLETALVGTSLTGLTGDGAEAMLFARADVVAEAGGRLRAAEDSGPFTSSNS